MVRSANFSRPAKVRPRPPLVLTLLACLFRFVSLFYVSSFQLSNGMHWLTEGLRLRLARVNTMMIEPMAFKLISNHLQTHLPKKAQSNPIKPRKKFKAITIQ